MKKYITSIVLVFSICQGISQIENFEYKGRNTGAITKDKLDHAKFLREITPQFDQYFFLPKAQHELLLMLKKMDYAQDYLYPVENYGNVMEYLSVTITANIGEQDVSVESRDDVLSMEQSELLKKVNQDDRIRIRIKFRFKTPNAYKLHVGSEIIEGIYYVTVVPNTEAKYPGGFALLTSYLKANVFENLSPFESKNMRRPAVKFNVSEDGRTSNIQLIESSGMVRIDYLILEAIRKMPRWTPAKNRHGLNIKQKFTIPFGDGC